MTTKEFDRNSSYQHAEGRTGLGQAVQFSCPLGGIEEIKTFLAEKVRTIREPVTRRVSLEHGTYLGYSRYSLKQHDYAGSMQTYIEVLEISDAPERHWGIVFYEYNPYEGTSFSEWDTVDQARAAFKSFLRGGHEKREKLTELPGFKRLVNCAAMTPWFYAIGEEEIVGDYAFPHGLQDDATYRTGRMFVEYDHEGMPSVKTCMGTRYCTKKDRNFPHTEHHYRVVYWSDGSTWNEELNRNFPQPIEDGELWIAEAVQQFRQLLAGRRTEFSINFTDGNKFVGKVVKANHKNPCAAGDYLLLVYIKGESKTFEGWVRDFKPTIEDPDIVQFVTKRYTKNGKEVERIEIKKAEVEPGGKKWSGVYLHPST